MPEGAPAPIRPLQLAFGITPAPGRWRAALIATLSLVIPATVLTVLGWGHSATLVTLGAFTAMYGTALPYRRRAPFLLLTALLLVVVATLGAVVGSAVSGTSGALALVGVFMAVAGTSVFLANALAIGPPGGFFPVMVTGLSAHVAAAGVPVHEVTLAAVIGAVSAWVVSMAPALVGSRGPQDRAVASSERAVAAFADHPSLRARTAAARALNAGWTTLHAARLRDHDLFGRLYDAHLRFAATITDPASPPPTSGVAHVPLGRTEASVRIRRHAHTLSAEFLTAVRVVLAVALAGLAAIALATGRPDWAMISAVLVLHGSVERVRGSYRAVHRIVGTVLGVGVFAVIALGRPEGLVLIAVLGVLQFVIEMLVVRNYGVAVVFITALVLLITEPPGHLDAGVIGDRVLDTAIGVAAAVLVLWTTGRRFNATVLPYELERCAQAVRDLAGVLETEPATSARAARARRRLQIDLLDTAAGADIAYQHAPERARAVWPRYVAIEDVGYDVLAWCWLNPSTQAPLPEALRARVAAL